MKEKLEALIKNVPNFPKEGVVFKDITPVLTNHLDEVISLMGEKVNWDEVDLVVGIESRGFILGSAMAIKYGKGFLPIRKKGKLPPPVISESYALEYGTDTLEMAVNTDPINIVLVDDVLATGGTFKAARTLCEKNHYNIKAFSVLIDLQFLNTLHKEIPGLHSVYQY